MYLAVIIEVCAHIPYYGRHVAEMELYVLSGFDHLFLNERKSRNKLKLSKCQHHVASGS
jgi:hypothetical protein